jgi:hypothetical protein
MSERTDTCQLETLFYHGFGTTVHQRRHASSMRPRKRRTRLRHVSLHVGCIPLGLISAASASLMPWRTRSLMPYLHKVSRRLDLCQHGYREEKSSFRTWRLSWMQEDCFPAPYDQTVSVDTRHTAIGLEERTSRFTRVFHY